MNVPSTRKFSNASLLCIWLLGYWAALLSLVSTSILHYALQNRPGKPPERIFWEPRITRQLWERIATVLVLRGVPPSQHYTGRVFEVSQGFYHSPYGLIRYSRGNSLVLVHLYYKEDRREYRTCGQNLASSPYWAISGLQPRHTGAIFCSYITFQARALPWQCGSKSITPLPTRSTLSR